MSKAVLTQMAQIGTKQGGYYGYGEVELAIAAVLEIGPEDMGALKGRLRHLRNLGFPSAKRPGSGTKIRYSFHDAFKMLVAIALEHGGFAPRSAMIAVSKIEHMGGLKSQLFILVTPQVSGASPSEEALLARNGQELLEALFGEGLGVQTR